MSIWLLTLTGSYGSAAAHRDRQKSARTGQSLKPLKNH
jgi:hypothetical protein